MYFFYLLALLLVGCVGIDVLDVKTVTDTGEDQTDDTDLEDEEGDLRPPDTETGDEEADAPTMLRIDFIGPEHPMIVEGEAGEETVLGKFLLRSVGEESIRVTSLPVTLWIDANEDSVYLPGVEQSTPARWFADNCKLLDASGAVLGEPLTPNDHDVLEFATELNVAGSVFVDLQCTILLGAEIERGPIGIAVDINHDMVLINASVDDDPVPVELGEANGDQERSQLWPAIAVIM